MEKADVERHFAGNYEPFYKAYLGPLKQGSNNEMLTKCTFHDDHNPSLTVNTATGLFHCFGCGAAGSIFDFYAKTKGLDARKDLNKVIIAIADQFGIHNGNGQRQTVNPKVVCRYDYQDETGALAYQIERLDPKSFRIRRPEGKGWAYNAQNTTIIPYHLPMVLKADEVLITEGEKDADNLAALGFTATTNPFGAGKWPVHFAQYFNGKNIILLPDNDDPGRDHIRRVAENLKNHAATIRLLELPGLPDKGDASDFIANFQDKGEAAERLAVMIENAPVIYRDEKTENDNIRLMVVSASEWIQQTPALPDQILHDTFDLGDKIAIIGSSKMRKSFFLLQMIICIASGRQFLSWDIPKPRKVLHIQLEIQSHHYHNRVRRMASALGIGPADLGDRLQILNARGLGLAGVNGITRIREIAKEFSPELISFDPLYKIASGVENAAEDFKVILSSFDTLAEDTGAAIAFVHHDAKGTPGDRDIRDRGAGSNVLGRDYDACLTLTPHSQEEEAAVVDVLLRNYRPQDAFTIRWAEDEETSGYKFEQAPDLIAEKKTSKSKAPITPLTVYLPAAQAILKEEEMQMGSFKESFKKQTGLSDHRIRDFLAWATAGGNPWLQTREERGRGMFKKVISATGKKVHYEG